MSTTPVRQAVHAYFMQRAIELARRGWYTTRPNPRVGCVIVRGETVIGEGWHERAGEDHAEKAALADVERRGDNARGATVYVTLEPCSHTGRTAPCVDALIGAGAAQVIVGATDPNPKVNGQGIARLRDAGIEVIADVVADRCRALNPGFEKRMREGRPRVRVKLAMSLDGRTAAADGSSQWITGDVARDDVHRLRAESGAVMVGRGTQQADDPGLNVRLKGEWPQPLAVVLDTHLAMSASARLFETAAGVLVYTASGDRARIDALEQAGAQVVSIDTHDDRVDLDAVLANLGQREINDVLVESGPQLAGALAEAGLVDEYVIYMAPKLLGDGGRGLLHMPRIGSIADARQLAIDTVEPVGADWRITARPAAMQKD
ncbi:bifunctional diaminohydroxyphosphoribosylaminopyrimidine deaminase/5-amino-6-(5-phosphoribosylamino)uracil reductase RibD [Salinisphaera sp. S4-8]|uniref:bifunctional diaminohydroxyphosphoribosylaminopyrimidine deaminase/5-amino-6-(5-phosphoribosylamino)uracil reductase RibD n=1 Tax=Salinisphaera sp. S4-8 TaxID=633357 RepID=UPI00333EEBA7